MRASATAETSSDRLWLAGPGLQLECSLAEGTLSVSDAATGWRPLPCAFAAVELEDGRIVSTAGRPWSPERAPERFEDVHGRGVRATLASRTQALRLRLELSLYDERPVGLFRLGLEHDGPAPLAVRRLTPLAAMRAVGGGLALSAPPPRWRFFRHGWQSWTPSLSLSAAQQDIDVRPPKLAPAAVPRGRGAFASEEVAALLDPTSGGSLLLGFVSAHRQWTQVRLAAGQRSLEASAFAGGAPLAPGETLWSERLLLDLSAGGPAAFGRYAEALGREMGARVPSEPPAGWCSWYYYFQGVTEEDVLKNLRFLQERQDTLPLTHVQIDDGYQANIGDWTTANEKFPHGMAWLAQEIRGAGFRPGLWLAPLLVGATSQLFAQHPDWVVRDDRDQPVLAEQGWGQPCYGLDCTHPQAEAWLRELFGQVADGWGYDYVKIDFLYGGAVAGRRHDPRAGRIEAYRRGLQAIRQGVGERFVLGCGALMGPSVGLVDGQRIGPDVMPWWRWARAADPPREPGRPRAGGEPSLENALRNTLTRSWMHGRLWANDPDCLLARHTRTKLTLPEVQSLATAIALTGGMVLVSDDLTQLSRDRLELVSLLLPPLGQAAVARDLLVESMPSHVELAVVRPFETWRLLARFNWLRRRRSLSVALPPGRWQVFELWERRSYGEREGALTLPDVPAHGVRLLALRQPRPHPQLLATTFHFSMGGRELADAAFDAGGGELRLALQPVARKRGELYVLEREGYRFAEARLDGERLPLWRQDGAVLVFRCSVETPSTLAVRFGRSPFR